MFTGDAGNGISGKNFCFLLDTSRDVKALKKPIEENVKIVKEADRKIKQSVENIKNKKYSQDGLTFINHLAGLFGQRLWFYGKPYKLKESLLIKSQVPFEKNKKKFCIDFWA